MNKRVIPIFILLQLVFLLFCSSRLTAVPDCKSNPLDRHRVAYTIVVDQSGLRNFSTVQSAIDSVPASNNQWIRILIFSGRYREKVTIPANKPCIFLEAEERGRTIIESDDHQQGATFTSYPNNIVAKGIKFKNTYNLRRYGKTANITQASSARIYGDKSAFFDCGFSGVQGTLWDATGRHYFHDCYISGAIDFIFGFAQSLYEDCDIYVNARNYGSKIPKGYITLQGRKSANGPNGFVFKDCDITGNGQAYLGRPLEPYSRVIIADSSLSKVIVAQGWDAGKFVGQEAKITYVEYMNEGAGANTRRRVPWVKRMNASEINQFLNISYINQDRWIQNLPRIDDDLPTIS